MPSSILNTAIPGFDKLTGSASAIIQNALSGLPGTANTRLQNAWYGAGTGLDSRSGFLTNRGYDLYRNEADQRQQMGIADLLKMISGYSGSVVPTPGQQIQQSEFGQNFNRLLQLDSERRTNEGNLLARQAARERQPAAIGGWVNGVWQPNQKYYAS